MPRSRASLRDQDGSEEPPPSIIATHVAQPLEVSFTRSCIIPKLVSVLDNDAATLKSKLRATLLQHLCKGGRPGRACLLMTSATQSIRLAASAAFAEACMDFSSL